MTEHLVLAGGGHTHALMLLRWAMKPKRKPKGLITLVDRNSTTLYSGMVPGMIAGRYKLNEAIINLHDLTAQAGVAFVVAEITGLDIDRSCLNLENRPSIYFQTISLDVGSETLGNNSCNKDSRRHIQIPIKPLVPALSWINQQDEEAYMVDPSTFTVIGGGLAGLETVLALRQRWPKRPLQLKCHIGKLKTKLKKALLAANISVISSEELINGPALRCTGSRAPEWIQKSGLKVDNFGRVITTDTLQAINQKKIFAAGDCAVIEKNHRPASGVWAVRAAKPLARNIERASRSLRLISWLPQKKALQLLGGGTQSSESFAWIIWGNALIGPHPLFWIWKEFIDRRFIAKFKNPSTMRKIEHKREEIIACRGCAAKVAAEPLNKALIQADLSALANEPQDSVLIGASSIGASFLQSVDGFPALVSDPWLNGRLTTLHACSDIWASGANVLSAQVVVTLPAVDKKLQQELLAQSLAGVQSALKPQGAKLIGGHTYEARSISPEPITMGLQVSLSVNGLLASNRRRWNKGGLQPGDILLLSRGLGTGVIFAAAMATELRPKYYDKALKLLTESQYPVIEALLKMQQNNLESKMIHACTDITGFGLLGHLGEILEASNKMRMENNLSSLRIKLDCESIPSLEGVFPLIENGVSSTLAPSNRMAWKLLEPLENGLAPIELMLGDISYGSKRYQAILELIVDPQTCGPMALGCSQKVSSELLRSGDWHQIGKVY